MQIMRVMHLHHPMLRYAERVSEEPVDLADLTDLIETTGFGEAEATAASMRYMGSFNKENFALADSDNIDAIRTALLREALSATTAVVTSASAHREALIERALLSTSMSVREISRLTGVDPRRISGTRKRLLPTPVIDKQELGNFIAALPQDAFPSDYDFARFARFASTPSHEDLQGMSPLEWFRAGKPIDVVARLLSRS